MVSEPCLQSPVAGFEVNTGPAAQQPSIVIQQPPEKASTETKEDVRQLLQQVDPLLSALLLSVLFCEY